jgi:hypothetical protein
MPLSVPIYLLLLLLKGAFQLITLRYLTSPIVELVVGQGETKTTLTAHQSLLLESPLLAERVAAFNESGPVSWVSAPRNL